MKKVTYLKTVLSGVITLFLFGLSACSSDEGDMVNNNNVLSDLEVSFDDEEKSDSLLSDSIKAAYNMIYGQWEEIYYMDGYEGKEMTNGPILTVKKNRTFSFSPSSDQIRKFKIAKLYKLSKDTLYSLVCHQGFDDLNSGHQFYRYDIEGDILHVEEEYFGTDFNEKRWRFKRITMP
jgi:hypothetical protein